MVTAVVTAGGRVNPSFAALAGTNVKALVPVKGRPLIYYCLSALAQAQSVGKIVVVGPTAALEGQPGMEKVERIIEEVGTAPDNILASLRALRQEERVLVCTSDVPHMTAEAVDDFMASCPKDADIGYAVVRNEAFEERYPGVHHMRVRLREGVFTGGSLMVIQPAALEANLTLINNTFLARKSKLGMVRLLGIGFVVKFLLGTLSIPDIEERARLFTGCLCRAVISDRPEVAFDIDDPEQVAIAEQGLENQI